jgi:hypothetical protein
MLMKIVFNQNTWYRSVVLLLALRRDLKIKFQCGGSGMFIPDPGSSSKNLSNLTPKKAKKWFLSSKKYDPGCSSRIPDPDADFLPSRIPDPGVKKAPNPGSRIRIRNTVKFYSIGLLHVCRCRHRLASVLKGQPWSFKLVVVRSTV